MPAKNKIEIAARIIAAEMVRKIVQNGDLLGFSDDGLHLLKGTLRYMDDKELATIIAGSGDCVGQAVAAFLVARIAPLSFDDRIELGKKMSCWRIWEKILEVPGLSHTEIRLIRTNYL